MQSLFMVAIEPPASLSQEVRSLQKEFAARFGSPAALRPPVHITIAPPAHLQEVRIQEIRNPLRRITDRQRFTIKISGFDFFRANRVVFLNVVQNRELIEIHKEIAKVWPKKENRPYRPHITVGYRNLAREIFDRAVAEYEHRHFAADFTADAFFLWKNETDGWKTVEQFPLLHR